MSEHRAKYGNKKTVLNGITFDSIAEAHRYVELKLLEQADVIRGLETQPIYSLQAAFNGRDGTRYRAVTYVGDFQYWEHGQLVVEDVKGYRTATFNIKEKLFRYHYPHIELRIIGGER